MAGRTSPDPIAGATGFVDVACPALTECVAVDGAGNGFTGAPPPRVTSTVLASSLNPAVAGQSVVFTATVSPVPGSGSVGFTDSGASIPGCTAVPVDPSSGTATCTTTFADAGSYPIQAAYSGDSGDVGSQSPILTQTVTAGGGTSGGSGVATTGHPSVSGTTVTVPVSCSAAGPCSVKLTLTAQETLLGGKLIAVAPALTPILEQISSTVTLGSTSATLAAGDTKTLSVALNGVGKLLLSARGSLRARLTVTQDGQRIATSVVTFKTGAG
jgi:hypothetical protein